MNPKLRIQNFKSLVDVTIDFNHLVFLFGPNGSGKSSLIKALRFLSENVFNGKKTLYADANYEFDEINLGSFKDIVSFNDESKDIVFTFSYKFPWNMITQFSNSFNTIDYENDEEKERYESKINNLLSKRDSIEFDFLSFVKEAYPETLHKFLSENDKEIDIEIEVVFNKKGTNKDLYSVKILDKSTNSSLQLLNDRLKINSNCSSFTRDRKSIAFKVDVFNNSEFSKHLNQIFKFPFLFPENPLCVDYNLNQINSMYELFREELNKHNILPSDKNVSKDDIQKQIGLYILLIKIFLLSQEVSNRFFKITHFPPIRKLPQQKYILKNNSFPGGSEKYFNSFLDIKELEEFQNYVSKNHDESEPNYEKFTTWHNVFSMLENLKLAKKVYKEIKNGIGSIFVENLNGSIINLVDASSGLIQILPIIVSIPDFNFIPSNFTWIIEQPELHLHPSVQANLAGAFIEYIQNAKKNDSNKYLILETHSEHMVRKLQVMVAKKSLLREKVIVYYFDKHKCIEMKIEENGFFSEPWPNGFFDDSFNLSMELLSFKRN